MGLKKTKGLQELSLRNCDIKIDVFAQKTASSAEVFREIFGLGVSGQNSAGKFAEFPGLATKLSARFRNLNTACEVSGVFLWRNKF